jgi:hypothetical protein
VIVYFIILYIIVYYYTDIIYSIYCSWYWQRGEERERGKILLNNLCDGCSTSTLANLFVAKGRGRGEREEREGGEGVKRRGEGEGAIFEHELGRE